MYFRVFGSVDSIPSMDEIIEMFDEAEFEVTLESEEEDEDEDGEETWSEVLVYENSLDGPIKLFRYVDSDQFADDLEEAISPLEDQEAEDAQSVRAVLEGCGVGFGIDLPDEFADEENALVLCSVLAQFLAQRCDGLYLVDSDAWFNDAGELVLEFAEEE